MKGKENGTDDFHSCCMESSCCDDALLCDLSVVDYKGRSLLHYAARIGNMKLTTSLIKAGISVNILDDDSNSPLFEAVHNGHSDVAKLLFHSGKLYINKLPCLFSTSHVHPFKT